MLLVHDMPGVASATVYDHGHNRIHWRKSRRASKDYFSGLGE